MRRRDSARSERGAAAVEFALIVPFLCLLIFGIISYGYMLSFRQAISQGAAEGARAAAVSQTGTDPIDNALSALNDAMGYGVQCASASGPLQRTVDGKTTTVGTCSVAVAACVNDADHQCATVSLDYHYRDHPMLPAPLIGQLLPRGMPYTAVARVD